MGDERGTEDEITTQSERSMSQAPPIIAQWTGEAFAPLARFRKVADGNFTIGENYLIETKEERSLNSHNHYFAALTEAWKNLREEHAMRFPTMEHLRKFALIHEGFSESRDIVASSKAEAQRIAAFVNPCDPFAVVTVRDFVVTVYVAKSQSMRAMGKKEFQTSKEKVLEYVASLVGVTKPELERA
jgi:hypothetical protein